MGRFIFILLVAVAIGAAYSYIINKFSANKLLLFLPSIIGTFWFLYMFTLYSSEKSESFRDLAMVIVEMLVFSLIIGNTISSFVLIYKGKKNH